MRYEVKMIESGRADVEPGRLECYLQDVTDQFLWQERPAVIICPGGAYSHTSDRESEPVAMHFLSQGFHAFSLRYSCDLGIYPTALHELARTVAYVRTHAKEFCVDPDRIILVGFSAGGHLAAQYSCCWREPELAEAAGCLPAEGSVAAKNASELLRPNLLVLGYPVITMEKFSHEGSTVNLLGDLDSPMMRHATSVENLVNDAVPPTFIWHTRDDQSVPIWNSLWLAEALTKADVPYELHIYPYGVHGMSLSTRATNSTKRLDNQYVTPWPSEADKFIEHYLKLPTFVKAE